MLKKFDKLYKIITEEIVPSEQPDDIKPTCSYCKAPVSIDDYLKQKKSYEEFTENELKLDRFWYKNENIDGYILERIDPPIIIEKMNNKIENCGYLIYKKIC